MFEGVPTASIRTQIHPQRIHNPGAPSADYAEADPMFSWENCHVHGFAFTLGNPT